MKGLFGGRVRKDVSLLVSTIKSEEKLACSKKLRPSYSRHVFS